jgi:alpha-1,2-mannosyltransferase
MRLRAQESAKRFTEEEFAKYWVFQMERLVFFRELEEKKQIEKKRKGKEHVE